MSNTSEIKDYQPAARQGTSNMSRNESNTPFAKRQALFQNDLPKDLAHSNPS